MCLDSKVSAVPRPPKYVMELITVCVCVCVYILCIIMTMQNINAQIQYKLYSGMLAAA